MLKMTTRYVLYKILKKKYYKDKDYNLFVERFENRSRIIWNYYKRIFQEKNVLPFFILGSPRVGSTLLVDYLNNFEEVKCMHEILNFRMSIGVTRDFSKRKAINHIKYSLNNGKALICGAKLFFWQLNYWDIKIEDIRKIFPNAKYIILYRKSLIEQYVSLKLAFKTGKWINKPYMDKIVVNPDAYRKFCIETKNNYNHILNNQILKSRSIIMAYEDFLINAQYEFDTKISPFLGFKKAKIKTSFKKQNKKSLNEVIENYEEIIDLIENEISKQSYLNT